MKKKKEFTSALKSSLDDLSQARKHWEEIEKEVAHQPAKEDTFTKIEKTKALESNSHGKNERLQDEAQNLLKTLKNKLDDFS